MLLVNERDQHVLANTTHQQPDLMTLLPVPPSFNPGVFHHSSKDSSATMNTTVTGAGLISAVSDVFNTNGQGKYHFTIPIITVFDLFVCYVMYYW